jgi:hypothetical protein
MISRFLVYALAAFSASAICLGGTAEAEAQQTMVFTGNCYANNAQTCSIAITPVPENGAYLVIDTINVTSSGVGGASNPNQFYSINYTDNYGVPRNVGNSTGGLSIGLTPYFNSGTQQNTYSAIITNANLYVGGNSIQVYNQDGQNQNLLQFMVTGHFLFQ